MADTELARKQLLDRIEQLIEAKHFDELRQLLSESRSADVAEVVEVLDEIARQILFDLLDAQVAGEVLEKIDEATRIEVVEDLSSDELTDIVATLPPDEAADVVSQLSDEQTEHVLDQIPDPDSVQIEKLLGYPEDTAGGIMNPELVKVNISDTVHQAIDNFRESDPEEDFYFIFVVDDNGVYKGCVGLDALLRFSRKTPISEVLEKEIPSVNVTADQEEIANTFRKNDLIIMPVVDEKGILLGRITVDDVVDVMDEEAEEDVLVMAGTHPSELDTRNIIKAATIRLPWLLTCMCGSMLSALILVSIFQGHFTKAEWVCITMFLPAIAAMGGNSGMQTSTVVVRGLATGDLAALDVIQVFSRESRVALIVAGVCAFIAALVANSWLSLFPVENFPVSDIAILALAVGLAMFGAIMLSTSLGLFLPYLFRNLGIDPAISSGPLITTFNDMMSFFTYISLFLLLMRGFR
ncbi:MAG: magnesium transporter [Sedimentisphaerales bacterium]|nr:magnesium transporter [Sedimentisphaerales bacterium]